ncbi:23604_t:CDS:2, partial [Gigaspora rosea]
DEQATDIYRPRSPFPLGTRYWYVFPKKSIGLKLPIYKLEKKLVKTNRKNKAQPYKNKKFRSLKDPPLQAQNFDEIRPEKKKENNPYYHELQYRTAHNYETSKIMSSLVYEALVEQEELYSS